MINFDPVKRFQYLSFNVISAVWMAIILLTNFPLFFDFYVGSSYAPKYYIFTLVIAIAYFLTAPVKSLRFVKEPFVWWFLFYFLVVYANYIRLSIGDYPSDYAEDEFDILERIIILPALAFICWRSVPAMLWLFLPIAFLVISFGNIYDLMFPGSLGPVNEDLGSGRADGFYFNANPAGEAVLLSLVLLRNHCPRFLFIVLYIIAGFGVLATFSRSGIFMWIMLGGYLGFSGKLPKFITVIPALALLSLNIFYDHVEDYLRSIPEYEYRADNMLSRLSFFNEFVEGEASNQFEEDLRGDITIVALSDAATKPLLGHGFGFVDPVLLVGPHNMAIELFHKYGIFGLIIWIGLLYCLWREERRWFGMSCIVTLLFFWFSFFSHNLLGNVFWFVAISIGMYSVRPSKYSGRFEMASMQYDVDAYETVKRKRRRRKRRRKTKSSL